MMFDNPCRAAGADRSKLIEPLLMAGKRLCADSPFATHTRLWRKWKAAAHSPRKKEIRESIQRRIHGGPATRRLAVREPTQTARNLVYVNFAPLPPRTGAVRWILLVNLSEIGIKPS